MKTNLKLLCLLLFLITVVLPVFSGNYLNAVSSEFLLKPAKMPLDKNVPNEAASKFGERFEMDSYEPDDSATQYTTLEITSIDSTQAHTIHTPFDQDWFRFHGVAGLIYTFFSTGSTDLRINLYADNGTTQLGYDDDEGADYNFYLQFTCTTTAYYKIKIDAAYLCSGEYVFHRVFGAALDIYEPDGLAAQAREIFPKINVLTEYHTLHNAKDFDWYKFIGVANCTYTFETTGSIDPVLVLAAAADTSIVLAFDDNSGTGLNARFEYTPTESGWYKIAIYPNRGSAGAYGFVYYYAPHEDAYEPDNSISQFTSLYSPTYETQYHSLHNNADVDWYEMFAYPGDVIHCISTGTTDTRAYLYDSNNNQLASDDDAGEGNNFHLSYLVPDLGQGWASYYLKVAGFSGAYGITTWLGYYPDIYEPDNSATQYTSIYPSYEVQEQEHSLEDNADQDWFMFHGVPGCIYKFIATGSYRVIYIYHEDGTTELANQFAWDSDPLYFVPTVADNYKLKVIDNWGYRGHYTFRYNYYANPDAYEPDESPTNYSTIDITSTTQYQDHTLHTPTDQDWFRFYAIAEPGRDYTISSEGDYTDTIGYIYQDDGTTLVEWDDNSGTNNNFSFCFVPPYTGWYKLKVVGSEAALGTYQLRYFSGMEAPINVVLTNSGSSVTITWAAVTGAVSYQIEASSDPYAGFEVIGTTSSTSWTGTSTLDRGFYRIRATDIPVP